MTPDAQPSELIPEEEVAEILGEDIDPSAESEADLAGPVGEVSQAVVTATDWTVQTVLSQLQRGNIQLNPRFQRRDAWTAARKSRFIESLFLGLPIPQLVLAEQPKRRGQFIVIDGKQRLLALSQFAASGTGEFDQLKLRALEVLPELEGLTLANFVDDPDRADQLAAFENQTIRTMVVRNYPNEDFLYRVFLRLNTGSVPLAPQELRQALIPGPFIDFAEDFSADSRAIQRTLGLSRPDFRMRDVELLIRFYAFTYFLEEYTGNLKAFLDLTCERLNAQWAGAENRIRDHGLTADRAIETTEEVFGDHAFRRWTDTWETRFNRAVFDVMVFYFAREDARDAARSHAPAVVEAFKTVSADEHFQDALQATTKSIPATHRRLAMWGTALGDATGLSLPIPMLAGNRIEVPA